MRGRGGSSGGRLAVSALLITVGLVVLEPMPAEAATFTVTNVNDSGAGSLRQAIIDAEANPGSDGISFNSSTLPNPAVITLNSQLPVITQPVSINGATHPSWSAAGPPVVALRPAPGLEGGFSGLVLGVVDDGGGVQAGGSSVTTLNIGGFLVGILVNSTNNILTGNYIGTDLAGTAAAANGFGVRIRATPANLSNNVISGNTGTGLQIEPVAATASTGALLQSNRIGTDGAGSAALGNGDYGVTANGSNHFIGGSVSGNVISGNAAGGVALTCFSGDNHSGVRFEGNWIGTNFGGTAVIANDGYGVEVGACNQTAFDSNTIGGNDDYGIGLFAGSGHVLRGNRIGISATGADAGNALGGVEVLTSEVVIGTASFGNTIAFNGGDGISMPLPFIPPIESGATPPPPLVLADRAAFSGNNIFANDGLGIDLGDDGVDVNDSGDGDDGHNDRQNYPVITSVIASTGTDIVSGTLNSTPNTTFDIELFSNTACDPSGYGEGETFLTAGTTTTNGAGNATFTFSVADTDNYTATARAPDGDTSEFSPCFGASGALPNIAVSDVTVSEADSTATFTISAADGVSVDYQTAPGTAGSGDFAPTSGTAVVTASNVAEVTVALNPDAIDEPDETFFLNLSNPSGGLVTDSQGMATILDDDPTPAVSVADISAGEGAGAAIFTISLSGLSSSEVAVDYATADGTATAGSDYAATSGTATISAGSMSTTVSIPVINDTIDEPGETILLNLSSPANATLPDPQAVATIVDDDPTPAISIGDVSASENAGPAVFTISLSGLSSQNVTVAFTTANGTATAPGDYTAQSGTATISAGSTSTTASVPIIDDGSFEGTESFVLNLSAPANATLADPEAVGTILDNEAPPAIAASDVTVSEDGGSAVVTLNLSAVSAQPASVSYATANGTAGAPADYTAQSGTATISAGSMSTTLSIPMVDDEIDEPAETLVINLSGPINSTIADPQAVVTIVDDEPVPSLSVADVSVAENGGHAVFTAVLSGLSSQAVTFDYASANGSATAPSDYTAVASGATIPAFASEVVIAVPVADDSLSEAGETFTLTLSAPVNSVLGDAQATGTIVDDDSVPSLTIRDNYIFEGDSGSNPLRFVLFMSHVSAQDVSVAFATRDGDAVAPSDYVPRSGIATVAAGATTVTVEVEVNGDTDAETDEGFFLDLTSSSGATLVKTFAVGNVIDDDTAATLNPPQPASGSDPPPDLETGDLLDGTTEFPPPTADPILTPVAPALSVISGPVVDTPAALVSPLPAPAPARVTTPAAPVSPTPQRGSAPPALRPSAPVASTPRAASPAAARPPASAPVLPAPQPTPVPAATPPAPPASMLQLDRLSVEPGGQAMATGQGCDPGSSVRLTILGRLVGTAIADDRGRFGTAVVLDGMEVGRYEVAAQCGPTLLAQLDVVLSSNVSGGGSALLLALFFLLLALSLFPRQMRVYGQR